MRARGFTLPDDGKVAGLFYSDMKFCISSGDQQFDDRNRAAGSNQSEHREAQRIIVGKNPTDRFTLSFTFPL